MNVEEFQGRWRRARRARDRVNQLRLEREAAGASLTDEERADWLRAKGEFDACERLWDEVYGMGVVVVVGDGEDGDPYSAG